MQECVLWRSRERGRAHVHARMRVHGVFVCARALEQHTVCAWLPAEDNDLAGASQQET